MVGSGYPNGLSGEAIPIAARIVALADVYDALSSRRVYKRAYAHEECAEIIRTQAGKQFDPGIVDIWTAVEGKFRDIARQYGSFVPEGLPSCAADTTFEEELVRDGTEQREAIQGLGAQ